MELVKFKIKTKEPTMAKIKVKLILELIESGMSRRQICSSSHSVRHPERCASSYALASKNDSESYHCMWYNLFEHTLCIARCTVCVSYYARCVFLTMHSVCFLLCSVSVSYYARYVFLTMHDVCFLLCRVCVSYYAYF